MPDLGDSAPLAGRHIVMGVSGGIAAYKSAELVRLLKKGGANVNVVMTSDAARFVTPLTLSTLAGTPAVTDMYAGDADRWTLHVDLGVSADLLVIAPAIANTIARIAGGFSDNMLVATVLAARCPVLVCPSMDHDMFRHPATQENLTRLKGFGYDVMPPTFGALASGLVGWGRMPEPDAIFDRIAMNLGAAAMSEKSTSSLAGRSVLVTAGPTREAIDPVRFLTNHSTGTMGFALAAEAARRDGHVTLVAGPTSLQTPEGVERVDVVSADDMHAAVQAHRGADVVIAAAAVADFAPATYQASKIKKAGATLSLPLRRTPDILAELGAADAPDQLRIGFALETDDELENARRKLREKNLRWIVVNNPGTPGSGFGSGTNRVTLLGRDGEEEELPVMRKDVLAAVLLDRMVEAVKTVRQ